MVAVPTALAQGVTRLLTLSFAAVIVYAALPTGAPWYAAQHGLISPIDRPVGRGWVTIGLHTAPALLQRGRQFVNPHAALPSLYAGYSFLFALFVFGLLGRGRWRLLVFSYPVAMAFVLIYGGEHFVVDILAGWALAGASSSLCRRVRRWWIARSVTTGPRPRWPGRWPPTGTAPRTARQDEPTAEPAPEPAP